MVRMRKALLRRGAAYPVAIIVVAMAACIVMLFDLASLGERPAPLAKAVVTRSVEAIPAPATDKRIERIEAAAAVDLKSRIGGDLSALSAFEVPLPLRSVDGTSFRQGEEVVRIAEVEGPAAGDVCRDGELRWSCGLQARAALHNLVSGRSLICRPRRALGQGVFSADCRVGQDAASADDDLARALVRRGWARPADGSASRLAEVMEEAKREKAGLWRGGWTIIPAGR